MKFDIQNPAFMQAACAIENSTIIMRCSIGDFDPSFRSIGSVEATFIKNGKEEKIIQNSENGSTEFSITCDPNSNIIFRGKIIEIYDKKDDGRYESLEYLDVRRAKSLNTVSLGTSVVSSIAIKADREDLANSIANTITFSLSDDGQVLLEDRNAQYNQIIIDAALDKGWDFEYGN